MPDFIGFSGREGFAARRRSRCGAQPRRSLGRSGRLRGWGGPESRGFRGGHSPDQILQHVAVHVGEPPLDAVVVDREPRVIDGEEMQGRGVEVVAIVRFLGGLEAQLVARAAARAPIDAAAATLDVP